MRGIAVRIARYVAVRIAMRIQRFDRTVSMVIFVIFPIFGIIHDISCNTVIFRVIPNNPVMEPWLPRKIGKPRHDYLFCYGPFETANNCGYIF